MTTTSPSMSDAWPSRIAAHQAKRLLGFVALRLAPALALGALAAVHSRSATAGALASLVAVVAGGRMAASGPALHASALVEAALHTVPLALGATAVTVAGAIDGRAGAGPAIPALFGASLVLALGFWVKQRFEPACAVRIAAIGSPDYAARLAAELRDAGVSGYLVCGWIDAGTGPDWDAARDAQRLGSLACIREITRRERIDLLVHGFSGDSRTAEGARIFDIVAGACLDLPVRMLESSQLYEELLGHVPLAEIDGAWFRYVLHPRFRAESRPSRRLVDLLAGGLLALLTAPLLVALALAVKLGDGGPALYRQRRVGEGGREFTMLKLRTMRVDAEREGEPRWCEESDPRVTPIGAVLRRTHLDELPQLLNVLRGEMSLVGPRPERQAFVTALERRFRYYSRRHLVKPGITGWAQVRCGYGGGEIGAAWKLCHDLYYLKRRSLAFDLAILVETVRLLVLRQAQYGLHVPDERFIFGETVA
jgi:exopolysaccharide biosynthesis polyprenyl glycosylphosphotransferase